MKRNKAGLIISISYVLLIACNQKAEPVKLDTKNTTESPAIVWKIHDMTRPKPQVITPVALQLPVPAPQGAVVLFDGTDLSKWRGKDNTDPKWKVENKYMEIVPGTGALECKESFGDVFLHVEWASPDEPDRKGQDRGNSGIFFMNQYEMQVLDSYQADTYADGQAGAIYGQAPPRFNACVPRGQWNSYDIYFRRPRFNDDSSLKSPARISVVHNGILIQDNEEYKGPTSWLKYLPYVKHADKMPITLQEHNGKVRFRNIWAIPLPELAGPPEGYGIKTITLADDQLDKFVGIYDRPGGNAPITVTKTNGSLYCDFFWRPGALELVPVSANEFALKETAGSVSFDLDDKGQPTGLVFHLGGDNMPATKQKK